ncbi:hypothetical protein [Candidatus Neptunichlamydia sp. REUL1]|uniref:hypothetical protein n=1 Tax=Candidatus Neptunichlamydia sp. REUL1 TaxID=3064277 RepID=UPI0029313B61|nr:hypothetical protein [Candidatus Neptunochlamydia sp. REUL1]
MNKLSFKYDGDPEFQGYYETFMECLIDVSDEKNQIKEWKIGDHDLSIVFTFDEIYQTFIDFCSTIIILYKDVGFSEEQLHMIKKLYDMFENYDSTTGERDQNNNAIGKTDAQIADDPKWHVVRDYAKQVYKELAKG